ncbi:hypothetical protein NEIRO03_0217 [Nematocida sp. AWRm78]|nr:hypothetical protein NEIRO02_0218 [Nematocida sp. AWRm79]KAI5182553.1 hypothetical protein NEIRO03_0217 [Nematocida sp. AWRm78]
MVDRYLSRVENYESISLLKQESQWEISKHPTAVCAVNNIIYSGTKDGYVFMYKDALYKERFCPTPSKVLGIESLPTTGIITLHESGTISHINQKKGILSHIDGFINGIIHKNNSWIISETDSGLSIFDYNKVSMYNTNNTNTSTNTSRKVFSISNENNYILLCDNTVRLIDIRTMKEEIEIKNIKNIKAGIFHSSSIEMIISQENRIKNIDIRNISVIKEIKTKYTASILHEYSDTLIYSGPNLFTRCVCPVTGHSLFLHKESSCQIASSDSLILINSNRMITEYKKHK